MSLSWNSNGIMSDSPDAELAELQKQIASAGIDYIPEMFSLPKRRNRGNKYLTPLIALDWNILWKMKIKWRKMSFGSKISSKKKKTMANSLIWKVFHFTLLLFRSRR